MIRAAGLLAIMLGGCTDPALSACITADDAGVRVQPVLTGQFGGLTVGVAP
ncbi:MAG: hypothetical protein K0B00_00275 [Rhodobacteraceae bacterium]|nr:hypothetical protein [Paracoccaceae bacterium]